MVTEGNRNVRKMRGMVIEGRRFRRRKVDFKIEVF